MTTASYEFSAEQNEIFKGLVRNMKGSGIVVAIASLILLAYQLVEHFGVSLGGRSSEAVYYLDLAVWCVLAGVGVLVAVLLVRATGAFTAVIHTEGNDVEHLDAGPGAPPRHPAAVVHGGGRRIALARGELRALARLLVIGRLSPTSCSG